MLIPHFNIYFETFCQELKHHFLTAWTDPNWETLELFAPSSEDAACSSSTCAAMIYIISRVRLRGKLSRPRKMMSFQLSRLPGLFTVFTKEEGRDGSGAVGGCAAAAAVTRSVMWRKGKGLEAVCPHNYIKGCRADLLSINPSAHKHSLTPTELRINWISCSPGLSWCLAAGSSAQ